MPPFHTDALNQAYDQFSTSQYDLLRDRLSYSHMTSSDILAYEKSLSFLDGPIGQITSRDQIIDPYSIVDQSKYSNSARGRALYNQDLARAELFAKRQEAAYQEWYNSEVQQAQRQFDAGLNANLLGVDPSSASSVDSPGANAFEGLPTNADLRAQRISNIASGISAFTSIVSSLASVASLASAFSDIPLKKQNLTNAGLTEDLLKGQIDGQDILNSTAALSNKAQLGLAISSDISDLLSVALQNHLNGDSTDSFDLESWFADDNNFSSLEGVYGDNPYYPSVLSSSRKAVLRHYRDAQSIQTGAASGTMDLANVISSPFYSADQKLTMIQLKPFMKAISDLDLADLKLRSDIARVKSDYVNSINVDSAASNFNNQNRYNSEYFSEANGKLVAAFEQFIRDSSQPEYELEQSINQGYLDMFNSDPSGTAAWKAAYLYGSNGGASWREAYLIRHDQKFSDFMDSEISIAKATGDFSVLKAFHDAFGNIYSFDQYNDTLNINSRYLNYYKSIEKMLNQAGYDIDIVNN